MGMIAVVSGRLEGPSMRILVTGAAGFIGFHASLALLERGDDVIGVDNLNDYYDPRLKEARLERLRDRSGFTFRRHDLADRWEVEDLFAKLKPQRVVHLAAQAGVRYSITNPHAYVSSNLTGTLNILECCQRHCVEHLVFASSSSVYGANRKLPYSEHDRTDHPVSLYAATKKSNELMAHVYASLYGLPCTGLRFFTVYGPWGRPDMAYYKFTRRIIEGLPIDVYNNGRHARDFTYIDDIVTGIVNTLDQIPEGDPDWNSERPTPERSYAPFRVYNIGNNQPVELGYFIETLEKITGCKAIKTYLPKQPGDVEATFADIDALTAATGFRPAVSIEDGLRRFVDWYRAYNGPAQSN
jgi:UDP-glucuronate 4-epimerase